MLQVAEKMSLKYGIPSASILKKAEANLRKNWQQKQLMELKTWSSQKNQAFQWKDETKGIKSRLRLIFEQRLEPTRKRENNVSVGFVVHIFFVLMIF